MSYCHINGNINPSRGFGIHPTAWMRKAIWESTIPFETTLSPTGFKRYTVSLQTLNPDGITINNFAQDAANLIEDNKVFGVCLGASVLVGLIGGNWDWVELQFKYNQSSIISNALLLAIFPLVALILYQQWGDKK
jgi:hypothetical protein